MKLYRLLLAVIIIVPMLGSVPGSANARLSTDVPSGESNTISYSADTLRTTPELEPDHGSAEQPVTVEPMLPSDVQSHQPFDATADADTLVTDEHPDTNLANSINMLVSTDISAEPPQTWYELEAEAIADTYIDHWLPDTNFGQDHNMLVETAPTWYAPWQAGIANIFPMHPWMPMDLVRPSVAPTQHMLEIGSSADTFVDSHTPGENYGKLEYMVVGAKEEGHHVISLVHFDVSHLPKDALIAEATLGVFVERAAGPGNVDIGLSPLAEEWYEHDVTYHTMPKLGLVHTTATDVGTLGWTTWDVTGLVQEWVSGELENFGVALTRRDKAEFTREFATKENPNSRHHPYLRVDYTLPPEIAPRKISLVEFDLSEIPGEAQIQEAVFGAYGEWARISDSVQIYLYPLEGPWAEDTVTWNTAPDRDETWYSTAIDYGLTEYIEWDVTTLVHEWVIGERPNYGLALSGAVDGSPAEQEFIRHFRTREDSSSPPTPPRLLLIYSVTSPTVTSIEPDSGENTDSVNVTIAGSGFQSGATIKLVLDVPVDIPPEIHGSDVTVVSPSQITGSLDLTDQVPGSWNVVVTNPDEQSGTLSNGFIITAPAPPPTILRGPTVVEKTHHSATITWETDHPADSVVRYGSRGGVYDLEVKDSDLVKGHAVVLTDLAPATAYRFVVQSTGAGGHTVVSGEYFFRTHPDPYADQPPGVESLTFSLLDGPFDHYRMTATVWDDVGIDKVEFYFGDHLVGTDCRRLDDDEDEYHAYVDPVSLMLDRDDFLLEHELRAVATNSSGLVSERVILEVPPIEPLDGSLEILWPPPDHIVIAGSDTVPPGTVLNVSVRASEYEYRCLEDDLAAGGWWSRAGVFEPSFALDSAGGETLVVGGRPAWWHPDGFDAPPIAVEPPFCRDVERPVSRVVIFIDDSPTYATTPESLYVDYDWDIGGYAVGETHRLSVTAIGTDGDSARLHRDISVERAGIDVQRRVVREGNFFSVELTITNESPGAIYIDWIKDNLHSFQAMGERTQWKEVTTQYLHDTQQCVVEINLLDPYSPTDPDKVALGPGASTTTAYRAVPIQQGSLVSSYRVGGEPVTVSIMGTGKQAVEQQFALPFNPSADIGPALRSSDYLIVTNPERLLDHSWSGDVQELLSAMAELAVLKNGVLGYLSVPAGVDFDPSSPADVRSRIWWWGATMQGSDGTSAGYLSNGHLLLVGEGEIIPAWDVLITGWFRADITVGSSDLPYANTGGSLFRPDLMVSRIIGNRADDLIVPIESSINVHRGTPGHGFDRSHALVLAGSGGGARRFENNADDIAELLADEFTVLTLKQRDVEDDGGDMNAEVRANIADRDVICYRGHGWEFTWSGGAVLSTWGDFAWWDPVDFGTTNPFAMALACGAGRYAGITGIAEEFLRHGAGLYIGSTEASERNTNNAAGRWFFGNWMNASDSVAYVFRELKDNLGRGYNERRWKASYNLYGDAKFDIFPTIVSTSVPVQSAKQAVTTLEVSIPDYEVSTIEGEHYVTILGGNLLTEDVGRPLVPFQTLVVDYPAGAQVQSVTMAERTHLSTTTGLHLPAFTPEWGEAGAMPAAIPQITGWWPSRDFDWHVQPGPLGTSKLYLHVYPFYYNSQTTDVRFYQDYTFDIDVITSPVEIVSLDTDRHVYAQGDEVGIALWLENTGAPQDVILDAAIVRESSSEVVDGLSLQFLPGLLGLASFHTKWDAAGVEPGQYAVDLRIRGSSGNVLQRGMASFQLGIHAGEITSITATPELFRIGDTVDISMAFSSIGTVPITGTAIVEVQTASDLATAAVFTHTIANLAPSSTVVVDHAWDTSGAEKGTYRVLGHVLYHSTSTDPVSVQVGTLPELYLPLVVRNH